MDELRKAYFTNKAFRGYVDRYADKCGIAVDVALTHNVVRTYLVYLESSAESERKTGRVTVEAKCGCD